MAFVIRDSIGNPTLSSSDNFARIVFDVTVTQSAPQYLPQFDIQYGFMFEVFAPPNDWYYATYHQAYTIAQNFPLQWPQQIRWDNTTKILGYPAGQNNSPARMVGVMFR